MNAETAIRAIGEALVAYAESPAFEEHCALERELVGVMKQVRDCHETERHAALVWFARSPWWHTALMLAEGWHGRLAREACRALHRELGTDTPGRQWDRLPAGAGRNSIIRLLGLANAPAAYYAAAPFKTWVDDDGCSWIAGAIGTSCYGDFEKARFWTHLDIRDVILWDPRTNRAMLAGEHQSVSRFVLPDHPENRLKVWGDCGAFFRAWAAERARVGLLLNKKARGEWRHPVAEADDGGLPGALLIGDYARAHWPCVDVRSVAAREGIAPGQLHFAVMRAAGVPHFEGV